MTCYELPVSNRLISKFSKIEKKSKSFFIVGDESLPTLKSLENTKSQKLYNPNRQKLFSFEVLIGKGIGLRFFTD